MMCPLPSPGWLCTRYVGHEGPCAALPLGPTFLMAQVFIDGFECGFNCSGEGFNGEYPFGEGAEPTKRQHELYADELHRACDDFTARWKEEHGVRPDAG